ncbi:uncharacterized protein UTRI_01064_B [Ustilago trichophora]|uniref:Uncharacterized protein n=1 Tax=Ustilago trichophora TaxID=86804 RepID=A0A5C3DW53_9BASI|nr:uncharacterized protein UTRI_01064_B [Ustilago trichophora]
MKIQAVLIASALAIVSADLVAGAWLDTNGQGWSRYCANGGSKLSTQYACFDAPGPVTDTIKFGPGKSDFDGYYSQDKKSFVVLLNNKQQRVTVKSNLWLININADGFKNCIDVRVNPPDQLVDGPVPQLCQPGAQHIELPTTPVPLLSIPSH